MRRRRFELREAVDRAMDMARPLLIQRNHTLELMVPLGLPVDADLDRIVQVLSNLLTNAAKYTPPGGHVGIVASASDDCVMIRCEDDGPGIPEALVPKLFDQFAQGPRPLDRGEGGLGLGLALARNLTELHGGTIRYESRGPEKGSRFVVTLPLASSDVPVVQTDVVKPSRDAEVRRILVVDDNEDARDMLQIVLQDAGHSVAIAGDGPAAIAAAAEFRPAVGVLDIGLPGMDGYELARQLRMSYPDIRLIALTGYSQAWDRKAASAAGFDAHCAKPVVTDVLLDQIEGRQAV
jgi:CheY-like chemotaxis protein/anti-sigma regulatory factor (Ser/Thr protein kinase)